jgi:hypothetical protein
MFPFKPRLALIVSLAAFLGCGTAAKDTSVSPTSSTAAALTTVPPSLGSAGSFAVLAGTAVTCTGTTITGNVGVSPGTSITQTSCPITGTIDPGDTTAAAAQSAFLVAYDQFAALPCDQVLTTLDAQTLLPGVYCFDAAATSTGGVLTLNGPSTGLWIFKVGTLGTGALTGTNFSVVTAGGAPVPCAGVYWWVAEGVTMTDSPFAGTILAGAAITLTRATFNGNALAKAAVTVTGDAVTGCATGGVVVPPTCKAKDGTVCECKVEDSDDKEDGKHGHRVQPIVKQSGHEQGHGHGSHDGECADDRDDHHEGHGE